VRLVGVRNLEAEIDRERLIADPDYEPPYWALLWSGATLLAQETARSIECRGRSVLDAGCGLGLTAVAAARAGGTVTAIDRDPDALAFLRASALANDLRIATVRGDLVRLPFGGGRFDLILAAEILYDVAAFADLAEALAGALAPEGSLWIADARRIDTRPFFAAAERARLQPRSTKVVDVREEGSLVRVSLLELRR
jgi:predicted nicotinamide N-methyase